MRNVSRLIPADENKYIALSTTGTVYLYENGTSVRAGKWPARYWDEFGSHVYTEDGFIAGTYNMNQTDSGFSEYGGLCLYDYKQQRIHEILKEKHRHFRIIKYEAGYYYLLTGRYRSFYNASWKNPMESAEIWKIDENGIIENRIKLPFAILENGFISNLHILDRREAVSDNDAFLMIAPTVSYQ